MIKVEGQSGLYKDSTTNTFINKNRVEIESARERKIRRIEKNKEEQELREKVDSLQDDISELKSMFKQLLEK
jgi:hypothetical protein